MKLTFLGTGTSCGVPVIGCQCEVCRSNDPHDQRTRCSVLVETEHTRLLIDCGPDFRGQILGNLVLNVKEQDAPKVLDYLRRAGCIAEEGN